MTKVAQLVLGSSFGRGRKIGSVMINWKELAEQLGVTELCEDGCVTESGSDQLARMALEIVIGEEAVCESVEYYIACHPGAELARSVLWLLRPSSAMRHCYDIYKSDRPLDERRSAVELLRVVADRRALPWIAEFLADADASIQLWGAGVVDQLLFSDLIEIEEAEPLLRLMENHPNESVKERLAAIRYNLDSEGEADS